MRRTGFFGFHTPAGFLHLAAEFPEHLARFDFSFPGSLLQQGNKLVEGGPCFLSPLLGPSSDVLDTQLIYCIHYLTHVMPERSLGLIQ